MAVCVLGIESSCDETAAAVVDETGRVHSDVVASQVRIHHPFGGVVPELASRHHVQRIVPVVREALGQAGLGLSDLAGVAATAGPGLVGALLVGLQTAKGIAWATGLPFVGVDHLRAHLEASYLHGPDAPPGEEPPFPHAALLVSGGHTLVAIRPDPVALRVLGATRDDAAGEAFDKVAKMLGLGYPGGPVVSARGKKGRPDAIRFPRALAGRSGYDFSFSGLKTAVRQYLQGAGGAMGTERAVDDVCASFQEAVVDVLVGRALQVLADFGLDHLVVAGGVAANPRLRERLSEEATSRGFRLYLPELRFCTDNAAMVARAGLRRLLRGERDGFSLNAVARWAGP